MKNARLEKEGDMEDQQTPPRQEWIDVRDRLPEQGQVVLAWLKETHLGAQWGCHVAEFKRLPEEDPDFPLWHPQPAAAGSTDWVTHWQPLPPPPKGAPQ